MTPTAKSSASVIIDGKRFGPGPIHDFVASYPRRIVVARIDKGWNECERCGREHRVWMTDDPLWNKTPAPWRRRRICVGCFVALVPESRTNAS